MPGQKAKHYSLQAQLADMSKKYIEVKGPFQIRDKKAASSISNEVLRLAKEHPSAKFILRESHRKQGSGSVYSHAFKTLTENDMGNRIHVVKAKYGKGYAHLGPPSKVREAKIAKLGAFKVAEFTYSGKVPSAEYKAWREVDISISKEKTFDPLRTKGQHLVSFGYKPEKVKKYVGGTASASKKVDAYIDRVSEYGRKKGAKQTSVDIAIEYIQDKSDEFAETQRYQNPSAEPIHMLSEARQTRLERLRKNYGTPPAQPGKVNVIGTGDKKIKAQVPIPKDNIGKHTINVPTFGKKTVTKEAAPQITKVATAPSPIKTPLKMKSISPASFRLAEKLKAKLETNQGTVTHPSEGVTKTSHVAKIKSTETVQTGTKKLKVAKSVREGVAYPDGVEPNQKGQVGTGLRESGTTTSFLPVGVEDAFDSGREFDDTSAMLPETDPNKPRYPEQSSDRVTFPADQKPLKNVKPIKYPAITTAGAFDPKNRKYTQFGHAKAPKPETLSVAQKKEYRKHGLKVPSNVVPIIQPFSKISSGMVQWDKHKGELDSSHSITPSDEFKKSSFESPDIASADKGGGANMETHTAEFMDRQGQGMRDDIANIEKQPWLIDSVTVGDTKKATKTTSITDVIYGDAKSTETNPRTGTQDKVPSATSPTSVGDPIKPYRQADPDLPLTVRRNKKPVSPERKRAERLANLQGEGTFIELKKNKVGVEYPVLKKRTTVTEKSVGGGHHVKEHSVDTTSSHTRAQQIEQNYVKFRNKSVTDFNAKIAGGEVTSKIDTSDVTSEKITKGTHSPMKTFSLKKKAPPKGVSAGSLIRKGFGLAGIASLTIAPLLAVKEVKAAGGKLTPANIASETARFMIGSDRVWSGYGAKNKGYFQKVGPTTKGVEGGRRPIKPIPGAGGPNTPYAKLKKSVSGAMIEWSKASSKASEALKYRRVK